MFSAEAERVAQDFVSGLADGLRIRTEFIRMELELGFTLLEVAKTRGGVGSQACVRQAAAALHAADRFLRVESRLSGTAAGDLYERRDELRQRLHAIFGDIAHP